MQQGWNQRHSRRLKWAILLAILLLIGAIVGAYLLFRYDSPGAVSPTVQSPQTAMFGIDAQHSHENPSEHILTPATVSHLALDWTSFPTGGSFFSSPVIADGMIYINSLDGRLYAYPTTGCGRSVCEPRWFSAPTGDRIYSTPAVANGIVYVSSYDRKLYAYNADGCSQSVCPPRWSSTVMEGITLSSPTVSNGFVFVGTSGGLLYVFDAKGCGQLTCRPLWTSTPMRSSCGKDDCLPLPLSARTNSGYSSSPAVSGGMVLLVRLTGVSTPSMPQAVGKPPARHSGTQHLPSMSLLLLRL